MHSICKLLAAPFGADIVSHSFFVPIGVEPIESRGIAHCLASPQKAQSSKLHSMPVYLLGPFIDEATTDPRPLKMRRPRQLQARPGIIPRSSTASQSRCMQLALIDEQVPPSPVLTGRGVQIDCWLLIGPMDNSLASSNACLTAQVRIDRLSCLPRRLRTSPAASLTSHQLTATSWGQYFSLPRWNALYFTSPIQEDPLLNSLLTAFGFY